MKKTLCSLMLLAASSLPLGAAVVPVGDMNKDGKLSVVDVSLLLSRLASTSPLTVEEKLLADVDNNGKVEKADVDYLLDVLLGKKESRMVNLGEYIPVEDKNDKPFD